MSNACLLCSVPPTESRRLCDSHSVMWTDSHEWRRAMAGPGDEHADSMFSDFVTRMRAEIAADDAFNLAYGKHEDCDCMTCRPP